MYLYKPCGPIDPHATDMGGRVYRRNTIEVWGVVGSWSSRRLSASGFCFTVAYDTDNLNWNSMLN